MHYNYGKVDLDGPLTALQASYTLTVVAARRGLTDGSSRKPRRIWAKDVSYNAVLLNPKPQTLNPKP